MLRHKRLIDLESPSSHSSKSRNSTKTNQTRQQQQPKQRRQQRDFYQDNNDNSDDLDDWRQGAQMILSDDLDDDAAAAAALDEYQRDQLVQFRPDTKRLPSPARNKNKASPLQVSTFKTDATKKKSTNSAAKLRVPSPKSPEPQNVYYDDEDDEEIIVDDNSSISFAQSGCHSILSAWRIKSANRAARAASRPVSVLSNTSSTGKRSLASTTFTSRLGKSPAAQTRIPLGPKQAQQFVTNTRRRRRANELILETLEARRALALSRQNVSLWGSESYLADGTRSPLLEHDDYMAHLSTSPSPIRAQHSSGHLALVQRTPSPALLHQRTAISDLGARKQNASPQIANRRKLTQTATNKQRPPLAKLDQNSSDLCSSNSSSSGSSTSGSQFTQLVTSELAPDCILLDEQALRSRLRPISNDKPPKAAERQRRRMQQVEETQTKSVQKEDDDNGSKLRRGALRRDSIRRLRLNRQQQEANRQQQQQPENQQTSSDSSSGQNFLLTKRQALSPVRKKSIEENPFLNRHHFRTSSVHEPSNRKSGRSPTRSQSVERKTQQLMRQQQQLDKREDQLEHRRSKSELGVAPASKFTELISQKSANNDRLQDQKRRQQQPRQITTSTTKSDEEEVERVEQMLRQLRPNQVFTSYSRESQSLKSIRQQPQPQSSRDFEGEKLPVLSERSKSTSDARFDAHGNRKQFELEERWRHEEAKNGAGLIDKRLMNERFESMRSSSISPPAEFADFSSTSRRQQQQQQQQTKATTKPPISPRPQNLTSNHTGWSKSQQASTNLSSPLTATKAAPSKRSQSVERPTVPARPSKWAQQPQRQHQHQQPIESEKVPKFERTADDEFRKRVDYLRRLARANLSEPLATRRDVSGPITEITHRELGKPKTATKPMTTNWKGPKKSEEILDSYGATKRQIASPHLQQQQQRLLSSTPSPIPAEMSERLFNDDRWRTDPLSNSNKQQQQPPKSSASTNLDLLADRYQTREQFAKPTTGLSNWRRSNSSLASLSQPSAGSNLQRTTQAQQKSLSPPAVRIRPEVQHQSSILGSSSDLSASQHSGAIKLMVRERIAPKLDYAVIEKQNSNKIQHIQHVHNPSITNQVPRPETLGKVAPIKRSPISSHNTTSGGHSIVAKPQLQQATKYPLRIASPRSPEFGATAASSNDDSAIASSVSSPSLSYMIPPPGGSTGNGERLPTLATVLNRGVSPTVAGSSQLQSSSTNRNLKHIAEIPSGILQSILRRQQQQQQQLLQSGQNSDSSPTRIGPQANFSSSSPDVTFKASTSGSNHTETIKPSQPDARIHGLDVEDGLEQQPSTSGSAKRVHFNDRTSVRSFESISSLASNSTAVPTNELMAHQQISSPDSMGSGSTSHLGAESPDIRKGGCAAIYAVRDDPELELERGSSTPTMYQRQQQQVMVMQQQQPLLQQMMHQPQQPYSSVRYMMQQPTQLSPRANTNIQSNQSMPFIRMTAPPTITSNTISQPAPRNIQYVTRPISATSTQIVPTLINQHQPVINVNDDEDLSYALRLRQAASSSRAFNYGQPNAQMMHPQVHMQHRPPVPAHLTSPTGSGASLQQNQQRKVRNNLSNYQTEV